MSRVEKYRNRSKNSLQPMEAEFSGTDLPSRKKKHPSSRVKLTQWFYRLLIVLFVALVAVLFIYGNKAINSDIGKSGQEQARKVQVNL
ncbi:hypothetical protein [Paenibacillus sp. 1P07SE]|uniref:hypothetical protein n=1 Tax=Paenibacillus sp. 1P07SE TaxID=3132209 RepID=UPI0039A6EF53